MQCLVSYVCELPLESLNVTGSGPSLSYPKDLAATFFFSVTFSPAANLALIPSTCFLVSSAELMALLSPGLGVSRS